MVKEKSEKDRRIETVLLLILLLLLTKIFAFIFFVYPNAQPFHLHAILYICVIIMQAMQFSTGQRLMYKFIDTFVLNKPNKNDKISIKNK